MSDLWPPFRTASCIVILAAIFLRFTAENSLLADGLVVKKRSYAGSLEERSQEAIIIFRPAAEAGTAVQDLILSIEVEGTASEFGWVVPFPNQPEIFEEDPGLFEELFDYVERRQSSRRPKLPGAKSPGTDDEAGNIEVLARNIVGDYEVTIVRETRSGGLNPWLAANDFQTLDNAEDVLDFYRDKDYVYACIRYTSEALAAEGRINSHPLRFRFATGGTDGMYFPMRLTGLQNDPFDVTLYVFCPSWVNDDLNRFGFVHRGLTLYHRDWDTPRCDRNAGKTYSSPDNDPYLKDLAWMLDKTSAMFQALYPGQGFYLTKIQGIAMQPRTVRNWSDDLWLFPYYTDRTLVPFDAREAGPASAAWPAQGESTTSVDIESSSYRPGGEPAWLSVIKTLATMLVFTVLLIAIPLGLRRILLRPTDTRPT
ncbi:MAG: DUF2330 domain-containing protein [Pirellulaceae bacterium]